MRVCFFGTYEENYPRNQILLKAFRRSGIDVTHCHASIWGKKVHKTKELTSYWNLAKLVCRCLVLYPYLVLRYLLAPRHDVVLIGYPGHLDVLVLKLFAVLRRAPVVFDCFISLHEAAIKDRSLAGKQSFLSSALFLLDQTACRLADHVILDTDSQIRYFSETFGIPAERFTRIFAGADDELFVPRNDANQERNLFRVLFVGKFTPLHGMDTIIEAAKILETQKDIRFDMIGTGQLFEEIESKIQSMRLRNTALHGWVPYEDLPRWIGESDLCLGIFADSEKAKRVIPNKVFQAMACGKPVLTARTRAGEELLKDGENAYLVPAGNPQALAEAILKIKENRKFSDRIARDGRLVFEREASLEKTAEKLKLLFEKVLQRQ